MRQAAQAVPRRTAIRASRFVHRSSQAPEGPVRTPVFEDCARQSPTYWGATSQSGTSFGALRARRERPSRRRAAEERDELAPLHLRGHSITSSASAKRVGGI